MMSFCFHCLKLKQNVQMLLPCGCDVIWSWCSNDLVLELKYQDPIHTLA